MLAENAINAINAINGPRASAVKRYTDKGVSGMLFKNIQIIDSSFNALRGVTVALKDDIIAYVGSWDDLPDKENWGEVIDGNGKLLVPGFYNSHGHTPMTLLRGYGENLSLRDWLELKIFPFEGRLNPDDVYFATLLGIAEMLRFGTVSVSDMYMLCDSMAQAVLDSGFKCNLSRAITGDDEIPYIKMPAHADVESRVKKYHLSGNGRLRIDISLHAEYTSTPSIAKAVAAHCGSLGLNMHVHVSETRFEHEECKTRHEGRTPARYLADAGVFDTPAIAAHCVWVEDEDLDILADKGVTLAANPVSNLKLASGICPIHKAMSKGINIGLGTDSVASNNNLNMFEEMKLHAILHKATTGDPSFITPAQSLACATVNGARAQGRYDCGSVKPGNKADLVVIDSNSPNMRPCHNALNNLVYAATGSEVIMTIVDGKVLYRDGAWPSIDIDYVRDRVEASRERILRELAGLDT